MSDNYFTALSQVKCEVEKKNGLSYVSWANAWEELKKIHHDANYRIYEKDDLPFFESKYGIDVKVGVTVNGIEHIVRLPVLDLRNKAMKDTATTFDINKTIQRAFAKAIAMHGIGLYVYQGEDFPEELPPQKKEEDLQKNFVLYYEKLQQVKNIEELKSVYEDIKKNKFTEDLQKNFVLYYEKLQQVKNIEELKSVYEDIKKNKFTKEDSAELVQLVKDLQASLKRDLTHAHLLQGEGEKQEDQSFKYLQ